MPECNTHTFQIYLNEFSTYNPTEFKLIVLDNGAFHKAKSLIIPENIALIFLPPYSPELNPAEKMWAILKRKFSGKLHNTLNEVSEFITHGIKKFTEKGIKKTCALDYVFSDINWTM